MKITNKPNSLYLFGAGAMKRKSWHGWFRLSPAPFFFALGLRKAVHGQEGVEQ